MEQDLQEAVAYYRRQGAPADQTALTALLREVQQGCGGSIPQWAVARLAQLLETKESFLLAVIRLIPSLRLSGAHLLELCGGPNCSKRAALAAFVTRTYGEKPKNFEVRFVPCMRLCGKGPNIKWDGKLYHGVDEALIRRLVEERK